VVDTTTYIDDSTDLTYIPNDKAIDTLSQTLKSFIPKGYCAISVSTGDANMDGLLDTILVLDKRKIIVNSTNSYDPENSSNEKCFCY